MKISTRFLSSNYLPTLLNGLFINLALKGKRARDKGIWRSVSFPWLKMIIFSFCLNHFKWKTTDSLRPQTNIEISK